jgi:phosphoglycolate phosphatase-like HAD superfamily hydrolase
MPYAAALVLFDIDGTLMRGAGPQHKLALVEAVRRVTGREGSLDHVGTHGMLDRDLIAILLRDLGVSKKRIREVMPAVVRLAEEAYLETSPPSLEEKLCPGVRPLLDQLVEARCCLGVVTGNLTAIGWRKLELSGIRGHFSLGAFSEQASTRALLAKAAIRHARKTGVIQRETPISLVGDHANDVLAAHSNRIRAVATGTGLGYNEELIAAAPHLYVNDLTGLTVRQLTIPFPADAANPTPKRRPTTR